MSNKKYFSYIRVSTQRQGQVGTSLIEQQASIERFAQAWSLPIIRRFEERETAAKQGRPVFLEMLKLLKHGNASGVIIHKIDRSARNLKDWADLGSLIDAGLEVHFASESLDLSSRGGRLSADIQAVVASDYIRNLREETKKGIYGRLRQGLFPFRAVVGYLDSGKGKPKTVDPTAGPLVRKAFELYCTGDWGLLALSDKMYELGLRNKQGKRVTLNGLSTLLHNPFYTGLILIKKTREIFPGIHTPIVSKSLFELVQNVLDGKNVRKIQRNFYMYSRSIRCRNCGYSLIAERQKGHVYYRCHTKRCLAKCLKEEIVTAAVLARLKTLQFADAEYDLLKQTSLIEASRTENEAKKTKTRLRFRQEKIKERLDGLLDAYMDGVIDKETYIVRKNVLITEDQVLKQEFLSCDRHSAGVASEFGNFLELANSAYLSFKSADPENKRVLVKTITSNFTTDGNSVSIEMKNPFKTVSERVPVTLGSPCRDTARTLFAQISEILAIKHPEGSKDDDELVDYLTPRKPKIKSNNYHFLQRSRQTDLSDLQ